MASEELLNRLENNIEEIIQKPQEEEVTDLDDVRQSMKKLFPTGPADVTSFIDFYAHVLAAESVYAIPSAKNYFSSDQICEAKFIAEEFAVLVNEYSSNYQEYSDMPDFITENINTSDMGVVPWFSCLKNGINSLINLAETDENFVEMGKYKELAKKIDGLISSGGYNFDVFQTDTINLGLRLIYRQNWEPIHYQTGELLNTIPLAPGEKIKYETKTWQTSKSVEEINEATMYSTEEILSATRRDILETLNRTSKKLSVKHTAEGGINVKVFKGKGSTSAKLDYEKESKITKQRFREAISKSTQSIKNERKVSINLATEIGSESKTVRDISNPNDEITVTYLFYELQRVYKVIEYLYDVVPVVYLANEIPTPEMIVDDWIIRHDWIIAGAILDKSFIDTLAFISNDLPGLEYTKKIALDVYNKALSVVTTIENQIEVRHENLVNAIDTLGGHPFQDAIIHILRRRARRDIRKLERQLAPAQEALDKAQEKFSQANFDYEQGDKRAERLRNHIKDNILHYMQAIWDTEHPDQRYLRLRSTLYPHIELIDKENENPEFEIKEWYPLADVVDTNQPLGYLGNYSIYRLMDNNDMVNFMAESFLKSDEQKPNKKHIQDPDPDAPDPNDDDAKIEIRIPSDAVYIEALPGTVPLLEHFKLMHRSIDMDKAKQEFLKQQLENLRRLELIRKGDLGDPEIEKAIISDEKGVLIKKIAGMQDNEESKNEE